MSELKIIHQEYHSSFIKAMSPFSIFGGCHCESIRFELRLDSDKVDVYQCNCSICEMKQNHHFVVKKENFRLLSEGGGVWGHLSSPHLKEYRFGSRQARHLFCCECGVQAFYVPRSNPEGVAITIHCVDKKDLKQLKVSWKYFDGQNWEKDILVSDITEKA